MTAEPDFTAFPPVTPEEEIVVDEAQQERAAATARALRHRAEIFVDLSKTDSFQEYMREKDRKVARMDADFASKVKAGADINQREVDYDRGFIDGLRYLDQVIAAAENHLKKLDRLHDQRVAESEPDDNEGAGF